jgi:hypothetical protein
MPRRILILESVPAVQLALLAAATRLLPTHEVTFAPHFHVFVQAMMEQAGEIELISIGDGPDWDGRRAAKALIGIPPTAFVLIHAGNRNCRINILNTLNPSEWPVAATRSDFTNWTVSLWEAIDRGWITRDNEQS